MARKTTGLMLAIFAITACSDDPEASKIVLGSIMPIDISDAVRNRWDAMRMATNEINAAGVFSLTVEPINLSPSYGTSPDPSVAAENAKTLMNDHGAVGVVTVFSGVGEAIIGVTNSSRFDTFVQCNASGTRITLNDPTAEHSDKNDTFYRTVVNDSFQASLLAKVVSEHSWTQVGLYWLDDPFGSGLRNVFLSKWSGTPVFDKSFPLGDFIVAGQRANLDQIISLSTSGGLDVIVLPALQEATAAIVSDLTSNGYTGAILLSDGGKDKGLFTRATNLAAWLQTPGNVLIGTEPDNFAGKNSDAFISAYRAAYGEEPTSFAPTAYDCTMALAYCLLYAGEKEYAASDVKTHLPKFKETDRTADEVEIGVGSAEIERAAQVIRGGGRIDFQGASGRLIFDAEGDRPSQGMRTFTADSGATEWVTLDRYNSALEKL